MEQPIKSGFTHGGKFHADDVFSSALLKLLNPNIDIIRGYNVPQEFDGIVFDIGDGEFDHHSAASAKRENGVPYAAFGLLWRQFGAQLVGEDEAKRFDEKFIQPLDYDDNTGCGNQLAGVIASFNPMWDSKISPDEAFDKAVEFAVVILKNKLEHIHSVNRARQLVEKAYEGMEDKIVVLPQFAPWKMVLKDSDAEFVVFPSQRGGYGAQSVPVAKSEPPVNKYDFPSLWAGLRDEQLQIVSKIKTLRFCHAGRFLITADTLQDAIEACKAAREIQGEPHTPQPQAQDSLL